MSNLFPSGQNTQTLLSLKVSISGLVILFLIAVVFMYFLTSYGKQLENGREFQQEVMKSAGSLAKIIVKEKLFQDQEKLQTCLLKYFKPGDSIIVEVIGAHNRYVLASNDLKNIWTVDRSHYLSLAISRKKNINIASDEDTNWGVAIPLLAGDEPVGVMVVRQPKYVFDRLYLRRTQSTLWISFVVFICIVGILLLSRYRSLVRMQTMAYVAQDVVGGKVWRRVPVEANTGIDVMGKAFNKIIDSLEQRVKELENAYEELKTTHQELEQANREKENLLKQVEQFNVELKEKIKIATRELKQTNIELDSKVTELANLKKFNENIFASISSGIVVLDLKGKITFINQQGRKILGLKNRTVNRPYREVISDGMEKLAVMLSDVLENKKEYIGNEIEISLKRGKKLHLGVSCSRLKNHEGKITGVVGIFRDITETVRLREQLERNQRLIALGQLGAGVAHEIRNPLGGIRGFAELLERELVQKKEKAKYRKYVTEIKNEVDQLDRIVSGILDFARVRSTRLMFLDVNDLLENVISFARYKLDQSGILLTKRLARSSPGTMADPAQLKQAFLNIIYNSCEAMPDGGKLSVSTKYDRRDKNIVIKFKDTGCGFDPEEKENIFNPFYTTKDHGTGLGLAIVHRIIENHEGLIEVESVKGKGTTFTITLKAATA